MKALNPLLLDIPESLETERLVVRRYKAGDGALFHNVITKNLPHLQLAVDGANGGFGADITTPEGSETYVRKHIGGWEARERLVMPFFYKETGELVGELWIECKDWETGTHEVGYFVVQAETKKGLASEATRAGIQLIFNELQGYKVALTCDEDNIASYRVAERCGFVREALIRDATQRPDGTRIGMLMYGMLKSEYEAG